MVWYRTIWYRTLPLKRCEVTVPASDPSLTWANKHTSTHHRGDLSQEEFNFAYDTTLTEDFNYGPMRRSAGSGRVSKQSISIAHFNLAVDNKMLRKTYCCGRTRLQESRRRSCLATEPSGCMDPLKEHHGDGARRNRFLSGQLEWSY